MPGRARCCDSVQWDRTSVNYLAWARRFLDPIRTDAVGAHAYMFCITIDECANPLKIRLELAFGTVLGMADVVASLSLFATN